MDNRTAHQVIESFLEEVLEMGFSPHVMEHAIWMELEARLGPLVHDAFDVTIEVDEEGASLSMEIVDRYLAERLLKRFLPAGSA